MNYANLFYEGWSVYLEFVIVIIKWNIMWNVQIKLIVSRHIYIYIYIYS
jgi:hypothetical protein